MQQRLFSLFFLHLQKILIISLQWLSGQLIELLWWQARPQPCSHPWRGLLHRWVHGGHGPLWQTLTQLCIWQGNSFWQKRPQDTPTGDWKQGTVSITSWFPKHFTLTNTVHGGHWGSSWHWWVGGCEHGWTRAHGLSQTGFGVPQGSGGYFGV